ncbi:hypothetical protein EHO61_06410 [Leptospira fluminis]|uniref:Uncharacterized protein n=1 Tax=Leptospira fluminis TaxID=2484979 RepID=A0A4R9GQZ8_9LEPT|nr:hypothetical protein [Leptospira fluminis]TGK20130.1 hypothetical protein EHO61_06410 [Leptospira fluminis]
MTAKKSETLFGNKVKAILDRSGEVRTESARKLRLGINGLKSIVQGNVKESSYTVLLLLAEQYEADLFYLIDDTIPVLPVLYSSPQNRQAYEMNSDLENEKRLLAELKGKKGFSEAMEGFLSLNPNTQRALIGLIKAISESNQK